MTTIETPETLELTIENETFANIDLSAEVQKALLQMAFTIPSPIQMQAIPVLMTGRDMIGQAQTGTGKTAAFAIPIIERIDPNLREVQAIVVLPTRELALQVTEEFRKLAKFKSELSIVTVYGGQPMEKQQRALQNRPQILIGTPGRMLDFLWRGTFHLNSVRTVVLDEADEMLNMGFRDDIEKIFDFVPTPRQIVLFSATMPNAILDLARRFQDNPARVSIAPKKAETAQIQQSSIEVSQRAKPDALVRLIDQYQLKLAVVFCNSKHQVDTLATFLQRKGYQAEGLHGGKTQDKRERILNRFRRGALNILVATDVASRGIDVRDVDAVINYDLPFEDENYTHRIGRTGRAGKSGYAFSLIAGHQVAQLRQIQRTQGHHVDSLVLAGFEPPERSATPEIILPGNGPQGLRASRPRHRRRPGGPNGGGGSAPQHANA